MIFANFADLAAGAKDGKLLMQARFRPVRLPVPVELHVPLRELDLQHVELAVLHLGEALELLDVVLLRLAEDLCWV